MLPFCQGRGKTATKQLRPSIDCNFKPVFTTSIESGWGLTQNRLKMMGATKDS